MLNRAGISTLVKTVIMFSLVAMMVGLVPRGVAAEQSVGSSYTSEQFGFSVTWDPSDWNVEPIAGEGAEGVELQDSLSFGGILGKWGSTDNGQCLTELASSFNQNGNSNQVVAPASKTRPDAPANSAAELYTFTYSDGAGTVYEMVLYAGCIQTAKGNAHVEFFFLTTARTFWRVTGKWGDVAEQITISQSEDVADVLSDTESKIGKVDHENAGAHSTGIDGSSYLNAEHGFGVAWDEEIWIATEVAHDNDQGIEISSGSSLVTISAVFYDLSPDRCLKALASGIAQVDGVTELEIASARFERPALAGDAVGELYTYYDATIDTDTVMYLECRELPGDGAVLAMRYVTSIEAYETELVEWQALLDGVEVIEE